eukprot:gene1103-biopygen9027
MFSHSRRKISLCFEVRVVQPKARHVLNGGEHEPRRCGGRDGGGHCSVRPRDEQEVHHQHHNRPRSWVAEGGGALPIPKDERGRVKDHLPVNSGGGERLPHRCPPEHRRRREQPQPRSEAIHAQWLVNGVGKFKERKHHQSEAEHRDDDNLAPPLLCGQSNVLHKGDQGSAGSQAPKGFIANRKNRAHLVCIFL